MENDRITELESEDSPDTEVTAPPTPASEHISVDVGSIRNAARDLSTIPAPRDSQQAPDTAIHPTATQRTTAPQAASLSATQKSKFVPSAGPKVPPTEQKSSNTTLQSMRKPELMKGAIPHDRRFLSIEHELADLGTALRVAQKRVERVEKRARWAWWTAGIAVLLAVLALAL